MKLNKIYKEIRKKYESDIKKSLEKDIFSHRYFYRPLSFWPSAVLVRLGFTGNLVTFSKVLILFLSFYLILSGNESYLLAGAILYFFFVVLDFCDGNVARYHNNATMFGKMLDGYADNLGQLIFLVVSLYTVYFERNLFAPEIELGLGGFQLLSCFFLVYGVGKIEIFKLENRARGIELFPDTANRKQKSKLRYLKTLRYLQIGIAELNPIVLILAILFGYPSCFILFGAVFYAIPAMAESMFWLAWAYKNLNFERHAHPRKTGPKESQL